METTTISNFRTKMKDYVSMEIPITISNRNRPIGIYAPYEELEPFVSKDASFKEQMAYLIVNKLLLDAPGHIRKGQALDLLTLPEEKLMKFRLDIESSKISKKSEGKLVKQLGKRIATRLMRRLEIARLIANAEKEGLFEASEHISLSHG